MPLLIDTYNVLHVTGVLPPEMAGIDALGLTELIARSRYSREDALLVCDGVPRPGMAAGRIGNGPIRVVYAGSERSADEVIERMIARSSAPRRLTVVSSDGRIRRAARRRRCPVILADQFLEQLVRDHAAPRRKPQPGKPNPPLADAHVDQWVRIFGLGDADLSIEPSESWWRSDREQKIDDLADLDKIDMSRILGEHDAMKKGKRKSEVRSKPKPRPGPEPPL